MTMKHYKCYSIECDGLPVLIRYSTRWDREKIKNRYCGRCKQKNILKEITIKEFNDATGYVFYRPCLDCPGSHLVSKETGRCQKCDEKRRANNLIERNGVGVSLEFGSSAERRMCRDQNCPICYPDNINRRELAINALDRNRIESRERRESFLFPRFTDSFEDVIRGFEDDD